MEVSTEDSNVTTDLSSESRSGLEHRSGSESNRLQAMQEYEALGTEPEDAFDDVTALAADLFGAPMALVSLVGKDRQWFKSERGLGIRETCIAASFCVHAIKTPGATVIPDAREDERVAGTPLVVDEPHLRFYAGAPLVTPSGHRIGTLCVLDTTPRTDIDASAVNHLERLAGIVVDEFELRREIQQRKEREAELEEARASAEASRKEAEDARDEAKKMNEAMTRFFAGVTHDLRTPLTRIRLFADLLGRAAETHSSEEGPIQKYLDKILTAAGRMDRLVDLLLDLAWLRSGKVNFDVEPTDLGQALTEAVSDLQATPEAQAREFEIDVAEPPLVANVDASAFRRVVENLIENALKYTSPGDRVHVRLRRREDVSRLDRDPGPVTSPVADVVDTGGVVDAETSTDSSVDDASGGIVVEIEDSGPGIAPEKLDTLFDPFTRVSTDVDGVGLGLTVAHDLVTAMDGTIDVESTLGEGTCFRITFPS